MFVPHSRGSNQFEIIVFYIPKLAIEPSKKFCPSSTASSQLLCNSFSGCHYVSLSIIRLHHIFPSKSVQMSGNLMKLGLKATRSQEAYRSRWKWDGTWSYPYTAFKCRWQRDESIMLIFGIRRHHIAWRCPFFIPYKAHILHPPEIEHDDPHHNWIFCADATMYVISKNSDSVFSLVRSNTPTHHSFIA